MKNLFATSNDHVVALLRLVLGIVFFAHGAQQFHGWFHGYGFHSMMRFYEGVGIPAFFAALAIFTMFLGGIGLIVGLLARIAAAGIAVTMLVAVYMVHLPVGFFMNWYGTQKGEGYEFHLLAIAIAVLIMVKGAGALSIDRLIAKA
jgi:putative oxidoreductase